MSHIRFEYLKIGCLGFEFYDHLTCTNNCQQIRSNSASMVVFQRKLNLCYLTMPRVRYDYLDTNLKSTSNIPSPSHLHQQISRGSTNMGVFLVTLKLIVSNFILFPMSDKTIQRFDVQVNDSIIISLATIKHQQVSRDLANIRGFQLIQN